MIPAGLQDRYEIQGELGRGATGVVYLGQDNYNQRQVAIKVAHPHIFADGQENALTRKAWLNEVRLAGSLKHPYIVEVFDAGVTPESAWLVMEYLPNGTLEPFARADQLKPVHEVLEIVYQCASALDYAGRNGVIHRDIKPANLQCVGPGEVKVGDFGAAYWTRSDATQVMDIGSLAYMSPELFSHSVTPQADIYALGVVLFLLLTAQLPFQGESAAALMYAIIQGERPAPSTLRPDLPEGLDTLVDSMLATRPEDRFADWSAVLKALGQMLPRLRPESGAGQRTAHKPARAEIYERLRQMSLLEDLNDAQIWELLRISRWYEVPRGTTLIKEGGPAKSCYLLLDGEAKVMQQGKLLGLMPAGTLAGELAFAEKTPGLRAATVVAATPATIGKWAYAALERLSPELQTKMLRIFFRLAAERLKKTDEQYLLLYRQHLAAKSATDSSADVGRIGP
jgi:eukaryotic-like serine/threonine-protein kinase